MNIDKQAPLWAHKEITIEAPIGRVWAVQTDIEHWPAWQPEITSAKLEGPLAAGSIFRWKAKGLNMVSTLHTVEPHRFIGWTGVSMGMKAIHNWTFAPQGTSTRVVCDESLSGWLARLMKLFAPNFLDKSLENSLKILKAKAESS